ncbi:MAG: tetratricopeptide repeat protein [Gammaproteobacteria bacterium]|nr:tetratricopeptide repeat protein [Gammaproteobacteria bacterium]
MLSHRYLPKVLLLAGLLLSLCIFAASGEQLHEAHLPALDNTPPLVKQTIEKAYENLVSGKQSADDWGEYGKILYANRLRSEAIPALQNARSLDPENHVWPYLLAYITLLDSSDKTIAYIEAAYKLKPSSLDVCYLLAETYASVGELDRAISAIQKAYELAPDNLYTNYYYAQLLMTDRQYAASKKYMLKAAQLAPTSSRIRARLLQIAKYTDIDQSLIPSASQATDEGDIVYPSSIKAETLSRSRLPANMHEIARMYMRNHKWRKAEHLYSLLKQHYNLTVEGKSNYAMVLTILRRYDEAEKIFNELIQEYPDITVYRLGLANLQFITRKPDAGANYQWVLDHAGKDNLKSRALHGLGIIAAGEGNLSRGRDLLQQAVKINSSSAEMRIDLIRVYADLKQFDQAFQQLAEAEKLGMHIPAGFRNRLERARQTGKK